MPIIRSSGIMAILLMAGIMPAHAQHASHTSYASRMVLEKLQTRVNQLERRLRETSGQLEISDFALVQASQQLQEYEQRLLQYEQILQDIGEAQASREKLTNTRLQKIEALLLTERRTSDSPALPDDPVTTALPSAPRLSPQRAQKTPTPDEAIRILQAGQRYLLENNYPAAADAMRQFLEQHTEHEKTYKAQYVLGEALLLQDYHAEAAKAYIALLSRHSDSPNAPEGLVKLAKTMRMMNDTVQACAILAELPVRYPNASALVVSIASAERSRSKCA